MKSIAAALLLIPQLAFAQPRATAERGEVHHVEGIRHQGAPPPARHEIRPARPSVRHVWVPGYWAPRNGTVIWVSGQWQLPPAPGYVWDPAHWEEQPDGSWLFFEGHWDTTQEAAAAEAYAPPSPPIEEDSADQPPPPPPQEVQPPTPFAGAVWIPGYWLLSVGRWIWVAGRWSAPPAGFVWEPHRSERGKDGRWRENPGHWRRR